MGQMVPSPIAWGTLYSFLLRLEMYSGAAYQVSIKIPALGLMTKVDQKAITYWLYLDQKHWGEKNPKLNKKTQQETNFSSLLNTYLHHPMDTW